MCLTLTMPEGAANMGVVNRDVRTLAERSGRSQRAKMRELNQLLAIRDQHDNKIEDDFRFGFLTINGISAG